MRPSVSFFVLLLAALVLRSPASPLLDQAAAKWMAERDHWAFTQVVHEFEGTTLKEEREERYDPSKAGVDRWQLISVDGKPPLPDRLAEWQKRKGKKSRHAHKPLADYFDFEKATALDREGEIIRYHLPLRSNSNLLFPVDRVALIVSIDRANLAIEKVEAKIDEPYRVALGLGSVLDVDLDLQMNPAKQGQQEGDPAVAQPDGVARVVLKKLGRRLEYAWSDFKRVTPHPDNAKETEGELEPEM